MAGSSEQSGELYGSLKSRQFLSWLGKCQFLKKGSACGVTNLINDFVSDP